jgi:hypothetical protein
LIKPYPTGFDLASLVEQATQIENLGTAYDDLESNLNLAPTQPLLSEAPQTLPSQVEPQPVPPQSHRNKKRALKRKKKVAEDGHRATHRTLIEHIMPSEPIGAALNLMALPAAKGGYSARSLRRRTGDPPSSEKEYTLADLKNHGITVYRWNGRSVFELTHFLF